VQWFVPSPDGSTLMYSKWNPAKGITGRAYAVHRAGAGDAPESAAPDRLFWPDGRRVIVRYPDANEVWIYETATGEGHRLDGVTAEVLSWQRR
jgi:hypothetical protein